MQYRNSKAEFWALLGFVVCMTALLTNGFSGRIFAQNDDQLIYDQIEPIGEVLAEILDNYIYEPDMERAVEGALIGIMRSLDRNSSFVSAKDFKSMQEDTRGEFDGIGVKIQFHTSGNVIVTQPIPGAPASKAGLKSGDYIVEVDGVDVVAEIENAETAGAALTAVSERIKGPRNTSVNITISRLIPDSEERERLNFDVKRGKIPLVSVVEARVLDHGVGYIRVSDFKRHTSDEIRKKIKVFEKNHMSALILDLRWNPGGLLNSSREVCELFLKKKSLVTYTRGKAQPDGRFLDDIRLLTEKNPIIPESMPLIVLVSRRSASSSEIVTGALQYHERAIIIGEKTFGKGSVQTVIPLSTPPGSALRLTTALYYTPANVTIDQVGILPDIEVEMDSAAQNSLRVQMIQSIDEGPEFVDKQNHGRITGNINTEVVISKELEEELGEFVNTQNEQISDDGDPILRFRRGEVKQEEYVNDDVLERAITLLREDPVFANIMKKYHRDTSETQRMASEELRSQKVR